MRDVPRKLFALALFAVTFAFVESAVVVYLRALYYPSGFHLPLAPMATMHVRVEIAREFATIIMLIAAGRMCGSTRWQQFAGFLIAFSLWDLFYYVWLKVLLDWPESLTSWDVLFLIPIPWIGPVIAPVLISLLLLASGLLIFRREIVAGPFRVPFSGWALACAGSALLLASFTYDTGATLDGRMPLPYRYDVMSFGIVLYLVAMWMVFGRVRQRRNAASPGPGEKFRLG